MIAAISNDETAGALLLAIAGKALAENGPDAKLILHGPKANDFDPDLSPLGTVEITEPSTVDPEHIDVKFRAADLIRLFYTLAIQDIGEEAVHKFPVRIA